VAKSHFVIRAANFCQLMPILADMGAMYLTGMNYFKKAPKHDFRTFWSVGCVRGKNSLRDSRGELLSINAKLADTGAMLLTGMKKFKKHQKQDFWTYWSVLGAFVAKTHFVIHAANFCQLMPILAHTGAMFLTGKK
jgi:hypothetical protein